MKKALYPQRKINGKMVRVHRLLAEKALGRPLPRGTVVHHGDRDGWNNSQNLVICENQTYHNLLHQRMRAYEATGHPEYKLCIFCKDYDSEENLSGPVGLGHWYHKGCAAFNRRLGKLFEKISGWS